MRRFPSLLLCIILASCQVPIRGTQKRPLTIFQPEHKQELTIGTGAIVEGPAIATGDIEYGTLDGKPLKGFLAMPLGKGPFPALILIHEWWGLNDNIRRNAQAFAQNGYIALAVDLYGESTTDPARAKVLATGVQANTEKAFDNLRIAVDFLRSDKEVDRDKMGSVGWCFGGGWSYAMAKNDLGMRATVMYYGRFNTDDDLSQMKSHILGHYGEQDTSILVDTVKEFRVKLKALSKEHEIYIYPNAGHGFANNESAAFDPAAADVAWDRTLDFLEHSLGTEKQ